MIKKISMGLIGLLLMVASVSLSAQELKITFAPTKISGAKYSPNHILAVWIKDANNNYVSTLLIYANKRKSYLYKWNANSKGDATDAVTGATTSTFKEYSLTWDLKDYKNNTVPAGSYKLCMEMTSDNKQGPYREIDFTTGGSSYTNAPADGQNFNNISLAYTAGTTGIREALFTENYLKLFPNPSTENLYADIVLEQKSDVFISVLNIKNQLILTKKLKLSAGKNRIDLSKETQSMAAGIYLFLVETNHYTLGKRLIIERDN